MAALAAVIFSNQKLEPYYDPQRAGTVAVKLADGTYVKGTVLGEITASPGTYKAYASGNVDGSQVAKLILAWDCVWASGVCTMAPSGSGGPFRETYLTVEAYYKGAFQTSELTGLDAAGQANLQGHLISGDLTSGVIEIG